MSADFSSLRNLHEQPVIELVRAGASRHPMIASQPDLLADVACVALNRLPPRYIRHAADLAFYQREHDHRTRAQAQAEAVEFAFGFVQARQAMRARG